MDKRERDRSDDCKILRRAPFAPLDGGAFVVIVPDAGSAVKEPREKGAQFMWESNVHDGIDWNQEDARHIREWLKWAKRTGRSKAERRQVGITYRRGKDLGRW